MDCIFSECLFIRSKNKKLRKWIQLAKKSKIDEFIRCIQVSKRLFKEITNAFDITLY
ncbi:transposase [Caldanaerobacter subterraneus]|uniref:transposase n=1 Tax=Caldanaerobacter subterraneus TaxID=911092 RepID=UPI003F5AF4D1